MLVVDFAFCLPPKLNDDFAESAGGDFWTPNFERRSKRKYLLNLQFESAVQIFEFICDEYAIQRDGLRQVMISYTAILSDPRSFGISTFS